MAISFAAKRFCYTKVAMCWLADTDRDHAGSPRAAGLADITQLLVSPSQHRQRLSVVLKNIR